MPITVVCGNCGRQYAADESLAGRRVRCRGCGEVVQIPQPETDAPPDLDQLAHAERTFAGGDALMATHAAGAQYDPPTDPEQPVDPDAPPALPAGMEDIEITGAGIEAAGRANTRFTFLGAKVVDDLLPWGLVLASLAWLIAQSARAETSGKPWLVVTRVAVLLILFVAFVWPLTNASLKTASRKLRFQLPRTARWRAFACYLPAMTLTANIWMLGGGTVGVFLMGLLAGLLVASGCLWILFRLTPEEAPATAGFGAIGFGGGAVISAAILVGLNALVKSVVVSTGSYAAVPASPIGSGFDWPTPPPTTDRGPVARRSDRNDQPGEGTLAVSDRGPINPPPQDPPPSIDSVITPPGAGVTDTNISPTPPGVTNVPALPPELAPRSPLVESFTPAPIAEQVDDFVATATPSPLVAAYRRDGENMLVTLWNSQPWEQKGEARFSWPAPSFERFAISPSGEWLARIVTFPRLAIQVFSLREGRMDKLIDLDSNQGHPQVIGFLTGDRVAIRWDGRSAGTLLDIYDVRASRRVREPIALPAQVTGNNSIAFSSAGLFIAVALRTDDGAELLVYPAGGTGNDPSRRIRINALDPRWPVEPTGMAFAPDVDSAKENIVALMFEQAGGALALAYQQDTGGTIGQPKIYPAGPPAPRPPFFNGPSLTWLVRGTDRWWLVYGRAIVNPADGAPVAELDIPGVERTVPVDPNHILVVAAPEPGTPHRVFRTKLNLATLGTR